MYAAGVILMVFMALLAAGLVSISYFEATLLFGLIAALSAPAVIHKVPDKGLALGLLAGLSVFASYPAGKFLEIEGFLMKLPIGLFYLAALWAIGFGWRRSWR